MLRSISGAFKNIDLILALYKAYINHYYVKKNYENTTPIDLGIIDFSHKLFQTMIKYKGENIIASKLITHAINDTSNNTLRTLNDMISCFNRLKSCDFDFSGNYSINNLHIRLSEAVERQENQVINFDYSKYEYSLQKTNDMFTLTLPENTHELSVTGKIMHICVGSYARYVIDKTSLIFILREKDSDKPVGCIQLKEDVIVQAKSSCNKLLQGQEKRFIDTWVYDKKLSVRTADLFQ